MRYLFCLLFIHSSVSSIYAQKPSIIWDASFGGNKWDYDPKIIKNADGSFTVAGRSTSPASGNKSTPNKGTWDYWVVKTDKNGVKIWDNTIGGWDNDYLYAMNATNDGGYLLAGGSASNISGDKSENNKNNPQSSVFDCWIVKLNAQGNKVWDKTYGGFEQDEARSIINTDDGGFLVLGTSFSEPSADKTSPCYGVNDFWLIKIDSNGNKIWDKTYGGGANDEAKIIIKTQDNNFMLAGWTLSGASGNKSSESRGLLDYWIIKIDENGNKIWDKTYGGDKEDLLFDIKTTTDGGFLISGISSSNISSDKSVVSKGLSDYWLIKIDVDGNKIWDNAYGGDSEEREARLLPQPDGGFIVAGSTATSISGDKTEIQRGHYDLWILKINQIGQLLWEKTIGGNNWDALNSIVASDDGGFVLASQSESTISGEKTTSNFGTEDFWLVKLNCVDFYSLKSGNWNDANTWSCGRIPNVNDNILIKSPHKIDLLNGGIGFGNKINTELGAILDIRAGAVLNIKVK